MTRGIESWLLLGFKPLAPGDSPGSLQVDTGGFCWLMREVEAGEGGLPAPIVYATTRIALVARFSYPACVDGADFSCLR